MDRLAARPVARANHRRPPLEPVVRPHPRSTGSVLRDPSFGRIGDHRRISVRLFNCQRALPDTAPVAQGAPDHGEPHMLTPPIRPSTSPPRFFGDPGTLSLIFTPARSNCSLSTAGASAHALAPTTELRGARTATRRRIPHFRPGVAWRMSAGVLNLLLC